jgi:hypothetical protein
MRILSLFFVAALAIGFGSGCSSSLGSNDGGGTGGGSGTGTGGNGTGTGGNGTGTGGSGGQGGNGGMTCSPACGSGSICVGTGIEGGALFMPNDAGVCPAGRHLSGNICENDLAYACMPIPAGCGGTVTCACASSLCPASHSCQGPSGGILTCIEAVP